jgi:hypothetical protein
VSNSGQFRLAASGTVVRCLGGGSLGRVRQPQPPPADATPIAPAAGLVDGADGIGSDMLAQAPSRRRLWSAQPHLAPPPRHRGRPLRPLPRASSSRLGPRQPRPQVPARQRDGRRQLARGPDPGQQQGRARRLVPRLRARPTKIHLTPRAPRPAGIRLTTPTAPSRTAVTCTEPRTREPTAPPPPSSSASSALARPSRVGCENFLYDFKSTARTAYDFRNLDNQRRRIRFACIPSHRLATAS